MAHYNFRKDIVDGEDGEKTVIAYLTSKYQGKMLSENKTSSHDVILELSDNPFGKNKVSFEIKTDLMITPTNDTGNMFIEYQSWGRPSGIVVCSAEWFIYHLKHFSEIWCIKTKKLLALYESGNYRSVQGGDKGSDTRGILINREKNRKHFIVESIR